MKMMHPLFHATMLTISFLLVAAPGSTLQAETAGERPNVLFITADDMNYDSSDIYGGPIKDLRPISTAWRPRECASLCVFHRCRLPAGA